jgi:CrcB protein
MTALLAVSAFGALGTAARYLTGLLAPSPFATLIVNAIGSCLIGVIATRTPEPWRLYLSTGLLGGFTTFSAFSLETLRLSPLAAALNIAANLALGLGACWLGSKV